MNKEIKYLLEEMEDNTQDYVGTNGCLYQDLLREELNLLLDYISNLQNQVKKQKGVIDKVYKKCQSKKGNYDYDVFIKLNESWKTLSHFKDNWNKLKKDLELVVDYGLGDESSKWDKIYGEYAKSTLKFMQELERSE